MAPSDNPSGGMPPFLARAVRSVSGRVGEIRSIWGVQGSTRNIREDVEHRHEQERQVDRVLKRLDDSEVVIDLRGQPGEPEPEIPPAGRLPSTL